jgi:hypothetical protein
MPNSEIGQPSIHGGDQRRRIPYVAHYPERASTSLLWHGHGGLKITLRSQRILKAVDEAF